MTAINCSRLIVTAQTLYLNIHLMGNLLRATVLSDVHLTSRATNYLPMCTGITCLSGHHGDCHSDKTLHNDLVRFYLSSCSLHHVMIML